MKRSHEIASHVTSSSVLKANFLRSPIDNLICMHSKQLKLPLIKKGDNPSIPLRNEFSAFWEFQGIPKNFQHFSKIPNYANELCFKKLGIFENFWESKIRTLCSVEIPRNS